MKRPSRHQLIALIATLLFHLMIVAVLLLIYLRFNPASETEREWPPVDSSEILFGGEYVLAGDLPDAVPTPEETEETVADEPKEPAPADPEPAEKPAPTASTATPAPSPAKVKPPKEKTPEKPKPDPAAEQQARRQQATSAATASRVSGAFSASNSKNDSKNKAGQPDGNVNTGANTSGAPGANLGGRTLASWVKARGNAVGTITIDVTVNRQGQVTGVAYNPRQSKGAVAASESARQSCLSAARQCRFSVATDGPELQRGTISFRFH